MAKKFNIGDRVTVTSECKTHGMTGTVVEYCEDQPWSCERYVKVEFSRYDKPVTYNERSLCAEGEKNMALGGKYRIARVKHVDGYDNNKEYFFALFDKDVNVGDYVLCDTQNGYKVANVLGIEEVNDDSKSITREIICKVDFSAFNHRKEVRTQRTALKKKLDKAVNEKKEIAFYEAVAKGDEEISALLDQYKALLEE